MEDSQNGDDLMSKISKNVEANLEGFQQRSAWETANSLGYSSHLTQANLDPKSSTKLPILDDGDCDDGSTLQGSMVNRLATSLYPNQTMASSSINIHDWPSPVTGTAIKTNPYHSVDADISSRNSFKRDNNFAQIGMPHIRGTGPNININVTNNRNYINESTFIRTDSLKSNSLLRLTDILSNNILLHPFVALRRICQVNRRCPNYICIQPFSLIPFIYHQQRKQGVAALYKGLSSELLVKGLTLGTETALANYINWSTEISSKRCLEDSLKILVLRGISVALSTPFLCSSVMETVQSVIVVKDRPSFVDCLREGFWRLLHMRSTPTTRIMPIWLLIMPTVAYHVAHLALRYLSKFVIELFETSFLSFSKRKNTRNFDSDNNAEYYSTMDGYNCPAQDLTLHCDSTETTFEVDTIEKDYSQITKSIIASFVADVALLPVETVLNSLYIQGTRTIIDNCDETTVVLPVLTNYDGFSDCYQSILRFEGNLGLYKGLGAIVLQYSMHFLLFRSVYYLLREFQPMNRGGTKLSKSIKRNSQPHFQHKLNSNNQFLRRNENNRHSTPNDALSNKQSKVRDHNIERNEKNFDEL